MTARPPDAYARWMGYARDLMRAEVASGDYAGALVTLGLFLRYRRGRHLWRTQRN